MTCASTSPAVRLLVAVMLSGCAEDPAPRGASIDTLASGIVRVRNDPVEPDRPPSGWEVRELYRVGSVGGEDGAVVFGRVKAIELDDDGNLYVLDDQAQTVRVFGPDGDHVRDIGGPGGGPGEFRNAGAIVIHEGELWVSDSRARRFTAFALDGTVSGIYGRRSGIGSPTITDDGAFYVSAVTLGTDPDISERYFFGLVLRDGVMEPVDTIRRHPDLPIDLWSVRFQSSDSVATVISFPVPFRTERQDHIDPRGGFWTATTDAFRFVRISPEGDTARIVERPASQRPVMSVDRAKMIDAMTQQLEGGQLNTEDGEMPEVMPLWSALLVDTDGRLWVEHYVPDYEIVPGQPRTWEIYDSEGSYLGALELPLVSDPAPAIRGNHIAGVIRDELGVDYVVVFEIISSTTRTSSGVRP